MSATDAASTDAEDVERIDRVRALAKELKIPRWEADRLLANEEDGR